MAKVPYRGLQKAWGSRSSSGSTRLDGLKFWSSLAQTRFYKDRVIDFILCSASVGRPDMSTPYSCVFFFFKYIM